MEKLEMEKVISGLLTVNGCDPERDTYIDITRLSCRLGFKVVNAELKKDEEGFIVIAPSYVNLESNFGNKVIVINNRWDLNGSVLSLPVNLLILCCITK